MAVVEIVSDPVGCPEVSFQVGTERLPTLRRKGQAFRGPQGVAGVVEAYRQLSMGEGEAAEQRFVLGFESLENLGGDVPAALSRQVVAQRPVGRGQDGQAEPDRPSQPGTDEHDAKESHSEPGAAHLAQVAHGEPGEQERCQSSEPGDEPSRRRLHLPGRPGEAEPARRGRWVLCGHPRNVARLIIEFVLTCDDNALILRGREGVDT